MICTVETTTKGLKRREFTSLSNAMEYKRVIENSGHVACVFNRAMPSGMDAIEILMRAWNQNKLDFSGILEMQDKIEKMEQGL